MKAIGVVASVILLVGCGRETTDPVTTHDIAGLWSYEIPDMQNGAGGVCTITGIRVEFTQTGTDLAGTQLGGRVHCTFPGGFVYDFDFGNGVVANGRIEGDSIRFDFNGPGWRSTGAFATPDSMDGIVNNIFVVAGEQYYWVGRFYSVRQS